MRFSGFLPEMFRFLNGDGFISVISVISREPGWGWGVVRPGAAAWQQQQLGEQQEQQREEEEEEQEEQQEQEQQRKEEEGGER